MQGPTNTPTPVATDTATTTSTAAETAPTVIATNTSVPVAMNTSTGTNTPITTITPTLTNTVTDTPTITPTSTPTLSSTSSPTPGSLGITSPQAADFTGITLNGANQTTTAALGSFVVSDLRGTGAGWHVTAQAAQFTGPVGHPLALSSLNMSAPTVAGSGTLPTIVAGPYTIDLVGPFQIASAPIGTGLGAYIFSATDLTLAMPASSYAGSYNSSITISVITAP